MYYVKKIVFVLLLLMFKTFSIKAYAVSYTITDYEVKITVNENNTYFVENEIEFKQDIDDFEFHYVIPLKQRNSTLKIKDVKVENAEKFKNSDGKALDQYDLTFIACAY